MPYRILMIAPTSFFLDYGCHVRIREEARVLQQFGHTVKIATYSLGRDLPGFDIVRSLALPIKSSKQVGPSRSKLLLDLLLAVQVLTVARKFRPQIIHAHLHEGALIGGVVSRVFGIPLVFDFQGSMSSEMADHHFIAEKGNVFKLVHWLESRIDQFPQHILTSSRNAAQMLTDDFRISPKRVTVLLDCVASDDFFPVADGTHAAKVEALRQTLNVPRERRLIVYIGLLDEYRGTSVMLDAAKELLSRGQDAHFIIIGFPNIERYQAYADQLGIASRVSFVGRVPYEDVPLWLALGEVALEPKMSATEAAGKVLNYMAMGLPTVAFDIPVMREYLGEFGAYAPLGDARAFADQIQSLLIDSARARAIGQHLRQRAIDLFSWEYAGRVIERVYDQVRR